MNENQNLASNLLFGLLCHQAGLLTKDQLKSALQVWLGRQDDSLQQIAVELQFISEDQLTIIDPIVYDHLKVHDHRVLEALRAVDFASDFISAFVDEVSDEAVRQKLSRIAKELQHGGHDPSITETATQAFRASSMSSDSPQRGGRFQIIRLHARGGLGEVFLARDKELNRDVALKEIQAGYAADTEYRNRFFLEAEVTGGLEHPGIVPVYGLGTYEDGRPFYAMRFIRGDSLLDAIKAFHAAKALERAGGRFELRKLLGRFVDVCNAISYAHARGVLHRDLKPGNIMLGEFGETLVVDWGLAKLNNEEMESTSETQSSFLRPASGSSVTPTIMGSAIGTLAYMPPEQASGQIDQLGPQSDVYSLGATLYHLLTGRPPFIGKDRQRLQGQVVAGDFPPPRSILNQIPKELEAICLKAMSRLPGERYASAAAIGEEIERYMADEPIIAYAAPPLARASRWVRKHPTVSTTAASLTLLTVVGLLSITTILSAKNKELFASYGREKDSRELAEKNEAAAKNSSQLALSTLTSVVEDLQYGLSRLQGGANIRRKLLETSLEKLEEVGDAFVSQASVDHNTITALCEMGDVIQQFGLADETSNIGNASSLSRRSPVQSARFFYQNAYDMARILVSEEHASDTALLDLALTEDRLGIVEQKLGNPQRSLEFFRSCLRHCLEAKNVNADSPLATQMEANAHEQLGSTLEQLGKTKESVLEHEGSLALRRSLHAEEPQNVQRRLELSQAHLRLGEILVSTGDLSGAMENLETCVEIRRALVEEVPDDVLFLSSLAMAYAHAGTALSRTGAHVKALEYLEEGKAVAEALSWNDPDDASLKRELTLAYERLAQSYLSVGRLGDAEPVLRASLKVSRELFDGDPQNLQLKRDLKLALSQLGISSQRLGNNAESERLFRESLLLGREILAEAGDTKSQRGVFVPLSYLGDMLMRNGQMVEAEEYLLEAVEICESLVAGDGENAQSKRDLARAHADLGLLWLRAEKPDLAVEQFEKSHKTIAQLLESPLADIQDKHQFAAICGRLGETLQALGKTSEAIQRFTESIEYSAQLVRDAPDDAITIRDFAVTNYKLGRLFQFNGDYQEALASYQAAVDIATRMVDSGSELGEPKKLLEFLVASSVEAQKLLVALGDWDDLLNEPADQLADLLLTRGIEQIRRGDPAGALQVAEELYDFELLEAEQAYNAACIFCLCAKALADSDSEAVRDLAQKSIQMLQRAIGLGWDDYDKMRSDPDLQMLIGDPEFEKLPSSA